MTPEERFPELVDFELELEGRSGHWSTPKAWLRGATEPQPGDAK